MLKKCIIAIAVIMICYLMGRTLFGFVYCVPIYINVDKLSSFYLKREKGILKCQTNSPGWGELHMGVKESRHLGSGHLPALNPGSDQSLPLLVPDNLHQAGVAFVHVLLQWSFQLLCSP